MPRLGTMTITPRRIIISDRRTGVNIGCVQALRLGEMIICRDMHRRFVRRAELAC